MLSNKELIQNLAKDTEEGKISWEISIEPKFIRATYTLQVTKNKKLVFKVVYYIDHPKGTKLTVNYQLKGDYGTAHKEIHDLGGSKRRAEVKEISMLLNKILLKEEEKRNNPELSKIVDIDYEDVFEVGDRVVVTREQGLGKKEINQKGTIIKELINSKNDLSYLVKFDNRFSDLLVDDEDFDFLSATQLRDGNCWAFRPENIKKIKDKPVVKEHLIKNQKDYIMHCRV